MKTAVLRQLWRMKNQNEKEPRRDAKTGRGRVKKARALKDRTPVTSGESLEQEPLKVVKVKSSSGRVDVHIQEPSSPEVASMKMLQAFGTRDKDLQNFFMGQVLMTFDMCSSQCAPVWRQDQERNPLCRSSHA